MSARSTLQLFTQAFRGFRADAKDLKTIEHFEQWKSQLGAAPFTNVIKRIIGADYTSGQPVEFPEAKLSLTPGKPVENLKILEQYLQNSQLGPALQPTYNRLKKFYEENSPKTLAPKARLANPPSDSEYFDLTSQQESKPIDWEFFKRKGIPDSDIQKLQGFLAEEKAKIQKQQDEINEQSLKVAAELDKNFQAILGDWAYQPSNLKNVVNHGEKEQEEYEFLMTASIDQLLERRPDLADKVNEKILKREWTAFEAPDDPRWETLKKFVPRYPKDVYREEKEHGHGKHH